MDSVVDAHKHTENLPPYLTVIAEQAREGVAVVDLNGAVRFINPAWAAMHGCHSTSELIDKPIAVFHTEYQMKNDVIPFIEEVKKRGRLAGPVDHVRTDQTTFPTDTLMVILKDLAGNAVGLICFATDDTEYERIRDELRRYRARHAELLAAQNEQLIAAQRLQQRLNQENDKLAIANQRLQIEINELGAGIAATDVCKSAVMPETPRCACDDREILVHVFSENIALQKPVFAELDAKKNMA